MLFFIIITAFLFLITISLPKLKEWNEKRKKLISFPGPKMSPIVGDSEFLTASNEGAFKIFQKRCNDFRSGFLVWYFFKPFVSLCDALNIERVISHVKHNEKSEIYDPLLPWLGTGLLTSTGQKWHNRRKILTPAFHFNILQEFLKIFHVESKRLVENLMNNCNKEIDIKPFITEFTLYSICETAMGISLSSVKDHLKYRKSVHDFGKMFTQILRRLWLKNGLIFYFSKYYSIQKKIIGVLHGFSKHVIAERKKNFEETSQKYSSYSERKKVAMLDLLLKNQSQYGNIDDEGIREEVDTFIFEGHDTTAVSLTYTLMLLANNTECQNKIYEEIISVLGDSNEEPTNSDLQNMKYLEMCIKESLRLYPSVPMIGRIAGSDIETVEGRIIPKGCDVYIFVTGLHRDPKVFPDPEKFDPDRFLPENIKDRHPFAYIPFSGGPRNCIGQKFAMMELKCCLTEILRNFILEPVDTPETLKFHLDLVLRNDGPVRIKLVPRK